MSSYDETLDYLYSLLSLGIRPGLERVSLLLDALGSPEKDLAAIHIAGTNGKGSTAAMIEAVLREAGVRTGLYTSPHLERINERIRVSGRDISDSDLVRMVETVREAAGGAGLVERDQPTFFEFLTAMALFYFRERGVEATVLETGMGGRFDATNVVRPVVSIITTVSLDHTGHLGTTVREVAREKAGIIKEKIPVVTGRLKEAALEVVQKVCTEKEAPLYSLGRDFDYEPEPDGLFDYRGLATGMKGLSVNLRGGHQFDNASAALAAIEVIKDKGLQVDEGAIRKGFTAVSWPARLEVVSEKPLVVIDSAHNPEGASALVRAVSELFTFRNLTLVIGISEGKDAAGILSALLPVAERVIVTGAAVERAMPAKELARLARAVHPEVIERKTVTEAASVALAGLGPEDALLVAGSIFVAAEARAFFIKSAKGARGAGAL